MSVVDDIKARLDIVELVSDYVTLQKAGRNFKALCPFHAEKTASFTVNPERQSWHCFGACATGGDVFSFVIRKEGLDFGETLRLLAQRTGVELVQRRDGSRNEGLYRINHEATKFYQEALASPEGKLAMNYLKERGVDTNAASTFKLGLSPRGRDGLKSHLLGLGFREEQALEAGLLYRGEDSSVRDFFWGRLMFPIHDRSGHVAGFGARSLDGSDPKYINTPATPIFDKRSTLYGLHLAIAAIREQNTLVVVEGYMDTITAHQYGYTNVVASMGTALTEQQVSQLKSSATNFVLALDPDVAGQEATLRSLESSWRVLERQRLTGRQRSVGPLYQREQLNLRIASLPAGRDPDDLIRSQADEWERLIREAVPYMEFIIPVIASRHDLSNAQGKAQAAEALGPLITSWGNAVEQEHYFQRLADVLGVSREALEASIGSPRRGGYAAAGRSSGRAGGSAASVSPLSSDLRDSLEEYVLALLFSRPDVKEHARTFSPEQFHKTENREIFTLCLSCSTIDELRDKLDGTLHDHLAYLNQMELAPFDRRSAETALDQSLRRLERRHLQELQEGLLASEDATLPPPRELEEAIVSVNTRLKELFSEQK